MLIQSVHIFGLSLLLTYSLVLGAALPSSIPVPNLRSITLPQVAVPRQDGWTPMKGMAATYNKFGRQMPNTVPGPPINIGVALSSTTSALPNQQDAEYLISVTVGNQTLLLDLDTGSSDLWVFSTLQSKASTGTRSASNIYNATSTKQIKNQSWKIQYGDGSSASGLVYSDKVTIGGVSFATQAVEAAQIVASSFTSDSASDGLIGMAFSSLNTVRPTQQKTFFDNIKASIALPLFTAALKRRAAGTYDFGVINPAKYNGSIIYTPVSACGYWCFTPSGYSIGGKPVVTASFPGGAIADTGTSLMYLPQPIVDAYWASVKGATFDTTQQAWVFPCASALPNFYVVITKGTKPVTVPGAEMNYWTLGSGVCYGGMQRNTGLPFSIFGDTFFKGVFTIFDASKPQLGFANQTGV